MAPGTSESKKPHRRPLKGSCHCGRVRFLLYLTLPHVLVPFEEQYKAGPNGPRHQNFYRCNCTLCHKGSFFHIRPPSSPDDFLLLSPLDPFKGDVLQEYVKEGGKVHTFFCKTCATRCFGFSGEGEIIDVDLQGIGVDGVEELVEQLTSNTDAEAHGGSATVKAWKPKKEGWNETASTKTASYLSVNAYAIDAGQEGFDLREVTEKKHLVYLDGLNFQQNGGSMNMPSVERPFPGGAY